MFLLSEESVTVLCMLATYEPFQNRRDTEKIEKARSWREAAKRVSLGPDSLPSICFYTFLNTSQKYVNRL